MKKLFAVLIALVMACTLCSPALAAAEYGTLYDGTELLYPSICETVGSALKKTGDTNYVQLQVDVVDDLEGHTIADYAGIFYDQYEYGDPTTGDCVYLMLYVTEDDNGLAFQDFYFLCGGDNEDALADFAGVAVNRLLPWLNTEKWSGGLDEDNEAFSGAMQDYIACAEATFSGESDTGDGQTTHSSPQLGYVTDDAGILTDEELKELESKAGTISAQYKCGVYIMTLEDYTQFGSGSIYDVAKDIYSQYALGVGEDKSGVLLLLSMAERDYALIAYGYGNTAFTDYGKEKLENEFLDDFKNDSWADGFEDYLEKSGEMLAQARAGSPLDKGSDSSVKIVGIGVSVLLALILSFVVCFILKANMESVEESSEADAYVTAGSVNFTAREDHFTHQTETRTVISKDSDSGGTSIDSDGFSGSSGKF